MATCNNPFDPFDVTEKTDPVLKLRVEDGQVIHVTVEVDGDEDGIDGACITLVPQVKYLPEGWSIDDARAYAALDLRSRRPSGWGINDEIRHAVRSGATYFAHEQHVRRAG